MLAPYRSILSRPGAALFSGSGLVARLPISMVGLGIVLLVEAKTGSYTLAGVLSGTHQVANAALAVPQGRLIDRLGQSRVLPALITGWGAALSLLMWSVDGGWPRWTAYLLAAAAGGMLPSVGTCVRARWSAVLPDPGQRQTAYALEAVGDEAVYMVGPVAVTLLATGVSPVAGLVTAVVVGVLGTWAFSAQRATEPAPHPRPGRRGAAGPMAPAPPVRPMPWRTIVPLTFVSTALGLLFGAAEVTTVAFADEHGSKGVAGLLLACWAAGSLLAGAATGAVTWSNGPAGRLRLGAGAMCLTMVPLVLVGSLGVMAAALFVAGFAIAPTLIATMSMAEQRLPASRLTEGMAFLQTGVLAGVAPGASVAGAVIDAHGASVAYLVSAAAGAAALLGALLTPADPA